MCTEYFALLGPCVSRNPRNYCTKAQNARENTLCIEYFAPRVSKSKESLCNLHVLAKPRCAPNISLSWARASPEILGITTQKRITLAKTRGASSISPRRFQIPRNHCVICTYSQNLGVHGVFRSPGRANPEIHGITAQKRIPLAKTRCASSISHRGFQNPRNHCVNCTCSQNLVVHRVFRSSGPVRLPKPWELLHKSA